MKVYGTDICIDCRNYKAIQKSRGFEAELRKTCDINEALGWIGQPPVKDEEIL